MADPVQDASTEKPTDPGFLRLQARVRALMLIGGLTLGIGLLAVVAAIIYRVTAPSDKAPAPTVADTVTPAANAAAAAPAAAQEPPAAPVTSPPGAADPMAAKAIEAVESVLPVRAWLVSVAISGDRIVLAYEHSGGTTMFVVDAATLDITGRLDLKPQSQ